MIVKKMRVDVKSLVKQLDIMIRMMLNTQLISKYRSIYKGKGLEFEDYRIYTPDDDASRIDWKASMRSTDILVKLFKEERQLGTYIMLDTSSSMIFGSTKKLKFEYAAEFAAAFSYFVLQSNDKAGLVMFNDRVVRSVPPGSGKRHFYALLSTIVNPQLYGGNPGIEKAMNFVMRTSTERGLIIIISDFLGEKANWYNTIKLATAKFEVIGVMIRDPRDRAMPQNYAGQVVLEDPYSNRSVLVSSDKIGSEYSKFAAAEERKISDTFVMKGLDMVRLQTDQPFIKPLLEFFMTRRMRAWR